MRGDEGELGELWGRRAGERCERENGIGRREWAGAERDRKLCEGRIWLGVGKWEF